MPIHDLFRLVQHPDLILQLVANLDTQIPLPPNTLPQPVQVLVLPPQHLRVVLVDLPVIQPALIRRGLGVRFVAVREQRGAVGVVLGVGGGVGEADGFVGAGGVGGGAFEEGGGGGVPGAEFFGGGEVGGEGGVVGVGG